MELYSASYGKVSGLDGVWSSDNILEECCGYLENVMDKWVIAKPSPGYRQAIEKVYDATNK